MNSFSRKAVSVGLVVATALWFAGSSFAPLAQAAGLSTQQVDSILSLLQSFGADQATINNVQAALTGQPTTTGGSSTPSTSSYTFTKVLTLGSKGADVTALQNFLKTKGYLTVSATGYFGSLTKAALAKFQAAESIKPASGYFGPITMKAVNAMMGTVSTGSTTGGTTVPTTGAVTVALSPNNPAVGSIIGGSAQNPVLTVRVSNGTNSDVTITGMTFQKQGVVADVNITNAYLANGNNIVAQYQSLSNGVLTFGGNLVTVPAGQYVDLTLRVDVSSSAGAGNTISFNLTGLTTSAGTVSATYPYVGNTMNVTTVSNPDLASISSFAYQAVASQVNAGTKTFRASAMSLTVNTNPVKVMSMKFTVTGSVNMASDLQNLVLKIDGTQVSTLASVASDGTAYFNIPSGYVMGTGSHTIEVYADVMGTPYRNFTFQILRPYDVLGVDTQYNANISFSTPSGTATAVTVLSGQVTMSLDQNSPTGNIAKGQSNVTLAKYDVTANGEAVRFLQLPFRITFVGTTTITSANVDNQIRNVALYDSNGQQVGSTLSQLSASTANCTFTTSGSNSVANCSFGSTASQINYLLQANLATTLTLKADIQSTISSAITGIEGDLVAGSNNIQGQTSFQSASSQTVNGSSLTLTSTPFTAGSDTSVNNLTYVGGVTKAKVASFSLSASAAEGINVSSLTFTLSSNHPNFQNMYVMVNGTQFGNVQNTVGSSTQTYTFSGTSYATVPAGGSSIVSVYADILSSSATGTYSNAVQLSGATATGQGSNATETMSPSTVNGQTIALAGVGTLSVSTDSSVPASQQLVLGTTGATLAQFRFGADNNENIKVTDLMVKMPVSTSTIPATFSNLTLWNGSTQVGTGNALIYNATDGAYESTFHLPSPVVVQQGGALTILTLKGDVASYTNSTASDSQSYQFELGSVTAIGASSQQTAGAGNSYPTALSNAQTTVRTKLAIASFSATGVTSGRVRGANDDVASLTLSVDNAYSAALHQVKLTFSGAAISGGATSTTALVQLVDPSTNQAVATTSITLGTSSVVATLNLASTTSNYTITNGTSKSFTVRVDSSNFGNVANSSDSMSVQIANASDLTWYEYGTTSPAFNLEATAVPQTVTISYE